MSVLTPERIAELNDTIEAMMLVSGRFYGGAVHVGNHPFIEFAGLMNEYIECCRDALTKGQDFTIASGHSGEELPVAGYRLRYINEKLGCIFTGRIELTKEQP